MNKFCPLQSLKTLDLILHLSRVFKRGANTFEIKRGIHTNTIANGLANQYPEDGDG